MVGIICVGADQGSVSSTLEGFAILQTMSEKTENRPSSINHQDSTSSRAPIERLPFQSTHFHTIIVPLLIHSVCLIILLSFRTTGPSFPPTGAALLVDLSSADSRRFPRDLKVERSPPRRRVAGSPKSVDFFLT